MSQSRKGRIMFKTLKSKPEIQKKSNLVLMFEKRLATSIPDRKSLDEMLQEKKMHEKKQKEKDRLVEKYNNRVKNFTLEMIHKPIRINDLEDPIQSTRALYYEETSAQILAGKGFVFSNYVTEKDRLKNMDEYKKNEISRIDKSIKDYKVSNIEDKVLIGLIQQPQMRYKPRTQLERIVENLMNHNIISSVEKKAYDRQFKASTTKENLHNGVELITAENIHTFNKESIQDSLKRGKLRADNRDAKRILKHLHKKTFFKGSTSINHSKYLNLPALIQGSTDISTKKKKTEMIQSQKLPVKEDIFFPVSQNDFYTQKERSEEAEFKLNYNPLVKFEENLVDYNKLRRAKFLSEKDTRTSDDEEDRKQCYSKLVKNLVKNKNKRRKSISKNNENVDEEKKEAEKVVIGSETINKEDINKITLKVLHQCNYFHDKNKNNNTSHLMRQGKTSITNGLTIKEFEKEKGLDYTYKRAIN